MTTPTKAAAAADVSGAETLTRTPVTAPAPAVSSPGTSGGGLRYLAAHVGMWTVAGVSALGAAIGMVPALIATGAGASAIAGGYLASKVWRARSASKGRAGSQSTLGARSGAGRQGRGLLGGGKNAGAGRGPLAGLKGKGAGGRGSRPGLMSKLGGLGKGKTGLGKSGKGQGIAGAGRPSGKAGISGKGARPGIMRKGLGALAGKGRAGKGIGKTAGLGAGKGSKSGKSLWPGKNSKTGGTKTGSGSGTGTGKAKGLKKLHNAARKAAKSKALGTLRKFFGSNDKPATKATTPAPAPKVTAPKAPAAPQPFTPQPTPSKGSDQHIQHPTQGGIDMGAINDAAEGVFSAVARADMGSARKLDALFADVAEAEATIAKAKILLGRRVTDEFGAADPGVAEMIFQQAATQAKFANDAKELKTHLRRSHHTDWERLDNPRNQEVNWDSQRNNQE